jgi:hypothetical protein
MQSVKKRQQRRRAALLLNLKKDVRCRLGVSGVHGVGVFAVRQIPKGTHPFPWARFRRWCGISVLAIQTAVWECPLEG